MTVFGYPILISIDFYDYIILRFLLAFSFDWEDVSYTQVGVVPHFQYLEVRPNTPLRVVFSTLFSVFGNVHARSNTVFLFDKLLHKEAKITGNFPLMS